jgi:hypothetical protein
MLNSIFSFAIRRIVIVRLLTSLTLCSLLGAASSSIAQNIDVSVAAPSLTIHPGDTNVPLTVSLGDSSFTGPITVTLSNLPSGITVTPLTLFADATGTLNISASVSADQEDFNGFNEYATTNVSVVAFGGTYSGSTNLPLTVSLDNPSFKPTSAQITLPIVSIDTGGQIISDDTPGNVIITSPDGTTVYLGSSGALPDGSATLGIHGNSTATFPKLSYNLALNTSGDLLTAMGLQCGYVTSSGKAACDKSKHFVLLANYDDKTFLRDWSASALANAIPLTTPFLTSPKSSPSPSGTKALVPWAPHSLFVELYLNGQYEGVYQLIEDVRVDSHRVNITELSASNTTSTAVTGGYLLEIDYRRKEDFSFITPNNVYVGLIDPDFSPEVPEQTTYIQNYVTDAEAALYSDQSTDPKLGWRAYFDEAAAANFYIVNDLMGNVDGGAFFSSDYLYKDGNNPLLYMGPVWDFDISSGNVNYQPVVNPATPWMMTQAPWYAQLFKDPSFFASVTKQWNALKQQGILSNWIASINQQAATLQQAQANNFNRWPMQGIEVWPNALATGSYDSEVSYLTNWLNVRMGYLDTLFNSKAPTTTTVQNISGNSDHGSPVTIKAAVSGGAPSATVSFAVSCHGGQWNAIFGTATLQTDGTAIIVIPHLPEGDHYVQAIYNGDNQTALSASAFTNFTVANPLTPTVIDLSDSTNTAVYGDQVTFTADIVANAGSSVPTGIVTFSSNGQPLGTAQLSAAGVATLVVTNTPAGNDVISAQYVGDSNYQPAGSNTLSVVVKQKPVITWATPASITYGKELQAKELNATANVPGTFVYSPALGTLPTAGTDTLTVTFTPTDPSLYTTQTASVNLVVKKATPEVFWLPHIMKSGVPLTSEELDAWANIPGTFTYSPKAGKVLSPGLYILNATFTPTDSTNYSSTSIETLVIVLKSGLFW